MKTRILRDEHLRLGGVVGSLVVLAALQLRIHADARPEQPVHAPDLSAMTSEPLPAPIPPLPSVAPAAETLADLLVDSIVMIESGGDPTVVGRHGERGLMQIKAGTWREVTRDLYGRALPFSRAFEPDTNRRVGKAYLSWLHDFLVERRDAWQADERSLLLACYNAGPGRVMEAGFALDSLPASTRDYIERASAIHDDLVAESRGNAGGLSLTAAYDRTRDT